MRIMIYGITYIVIMIYKTQQEKRNSYYCEIVCKNIARAHHVFTHGLHSIIRSMKFSWWPYVIIKTHSYINIFD